MQCYVGSHMLCCVCMCVCVCMSYVCDRYGYMFWVDLHSDAIMRADLEDGLNVTVIINSTLVGPSKSTHNIQTYTSTNFTHIHSFIRSFIHSFIHSFILSPFIITRNPGFYFLQLLFLQLISLRNVCSSLYCMCSSVCAVVYVQ